MHACAKARAGILADKKRCEIGASNVGEPESTYAILSHFENITKHGPIGIRIK